MWGMVKAAFAFVAVEMAANELGVPDWAHFIGWALVLAGYVAHSEK